ncbi:MAG: HAMP domain-containing histidine kinase [Planctomycetes bacterium]|nr:HAMP domain-containing histidine kinase [Planctomycetota bacterium]
MMEGVGVNGARQKVSAAFTEFAPAARKGEEEILADIKLLAGEENLRQIFDSLPSFALVLNEERQVVYGSQSLTTLLGSDAAVSAIGMRPGEVLCCTNARRTEGGCGTTLNCRTCGAINSILGSRKSGGGETRECAISTRKDDCEATLELRVKSSPIKVGGREFTLFFIDDISHEKHLEYLERIFFHDILNSASGINGLAHMLARGGDAEDYISLLASASEMLLEEIRSQRDLLSAERSSLQVRLEDLPSVSLVEEVLVQLKNYESFHEVGVELGGIPPVTLSTDRTLARRVLLNILKNALEASAEGERIRIDGELRGPKLSIRVHNSAVMCEEVKSGIFKRNFSTKGSGHGLGTYGMKLLMARYLEGEVCFSSEPGKGTSFFAVFPLSRAEKS